MRRLEVGRAHGTQNGQPDQPPPVPHQASTYGGAECKQPPIVSTTREKKSRHLSKSHEPSTTWLFRHRTLRAETLRALGCRALWAEVKSRLKTPNQNTTIQLDMQLSGNDGEAVPQGSRVVR